MKIAFCAAEAAPFAKVGGLGDVVGSLPNALVKLGHEVIVIIPGYGCIDTQAFSLTDTHLAFSITHRNQTYQVSVMESTLPGADVPIYFIQNAKLYGASESIYPWVDPVFEATRFEVLGKAALQLVKALSWQPDVFHVHDWHTSNIPVYLQELKGVDPFYQNMGTVLTIHNMAYQGIVEDTNWLREGLINSDALVAVSPTYAREILTADSGAGLEAVVEAQRHKLTGILNGIDMGVFNPQADPFIAKQYGAEAVEEGKRVCKTHLQAEMGLEQTFERPILGMVTRLVEQKGLDLLVDLLPKLQELPAQFVFLGAGHEAYVTALNAMNSHSENIRFRLGYNLPLGQHIYAGSDFFLMPSRFEPCGLSQMIALRYGTVPLVRKTGGLADTIVDLETDSEERNGIVFEAYSAAALFEAITRAIAVWQSQPAFWWPMVKRGMQQDMSWTRSAKAYQTIYHQVHQQALQKV